MKLYCLYLTNSSLCFSVDPLTEKYPNFSPYAYTFNNPVNYTDPMGMEGEGVDNDYKLEKDGRITLIRKTNDKSDTLYASESYNGMTDYSKSVTVDKATQESEIVISQTTEPLSAVNSSIVYTNNAKDAVNVFNFLNTNTNEGIEFGIMKYSSNGSNNNYLISTNFSIADNTQGFIRSIDFIDGYKNMIAFLHNHDGYLGFHPEISNQWSADLYTQTTQDRQLKSKTVPRWLTVVHTGLNNQLQELYSYDSKPVRKKLNDVFNANFFKNLRKRYK